jgi:uncharacterized Zn finger protein
VLAEDLRGARGCGEIVAMLRDAGRDGDAEQWARTGLAGECSDPWADELRDQLAELLLGSGRGDEAIAIYRAAFERRTIHRDYLRLRQAAERAGQWPDLRDWALDLLRGRARAEAFRLRELIRVLVHEDLLDEAWATAVASPGQVPEAQWHELIGLREKDHPVDVIRPFQDLIELGLERTSDKYRYPRAIKALKRLREDYARAGDLAGFAAYLDNLRQRQRRKTSFIAKLDAAFPPRPRQ